MSTQGTQPYTEGHGNAPEHTHLAALHSHDHYHVSHHHRGSPLGEWEHRTYWRIPTNTITMRSRTATISATRMKSKCIRKRRIFTITPPRRRRRHNGASMWFQTAGIQQPPAPPDPLPEPVPHPEPLPDPMPHPDPLPDPLPLDPPVPRGY
jgi:hypothetical protein